MSAEDDPLEPRADGEGAGAGGIIGRGEDALGSIAQALLENPLFAQALGATLGAGERVAGAQKVAYDALDVSRATEVERLERRIRQLGQRLETLEDTVDDLNRELSSLRKQGS